METMTVAEFKSRFSEVISDVARGKSVQILYGRTHRPVALVSAISEPQTRRKLGTYDGIATFSETDGGKITEEEFLGL